MALNSNLDQTRYTEQGYQLTDKPYNVIPDYTNGSGSAVEKGDFVLIDGGNGYGYFGFWLEDVANGSAGPVFIGDEVVVEVKPTLRGTSQTFTTRFQDVYFNPSDGKFYEATAFGYALVGQVIKVEDSANVFRFLKKRRVAIDTTT